MRDRTEREAPKETEGDSGVVRNRIQAYFFYYTKYEVKLSMLSVPTAYYLDFMHARNTRMYTRLARISEYET